MIPELQLPHDVVVALDAPVVVGRDPVAPAGLPGAVAVALAGDLSVSKTHALVECVGGSVWVTDLDSSNGTEIIGVDGIETRLSPGIPTIAPVGSVVRVGSVSDIAVRGPRSVLPSATANRVVDVVPTAVSPIAPPSVVVPAAATGGWEPAQALVPAPAPVQPVDISPDVDADAAVKRRASRRRLGGWLIVGWGAVTTFSTVTTGMSFVVLVLVLWPVLAAGWMLWQIDDDRRMSAAFWSTAVAVVLLHVGGLFFLERPVRLGITEFFGLALAIGGAVLLRLSAEPSHRPSPGSVGAGNRLLPDGTVAPTRSYGLEPLPLGSRFGAYVLDCILIFLTLGIGWLVWSLVVWDRGQSPGKQAVGAVVVDVRTGEVARFGTMALREIVGKGFIGALTFGITGVLSSFMVLFGAERRGVHDSVATTIVVRADPRVRQP